MTIVDLLEVWASDLPPAYTHKREQGGWKATSRKEPLRDVLLFFKDGNWVATCDVDGNIWGPVSVLLSWNELEDQDPSKPDVKVRHLPLKAADPNSLASLKSFITRFDAKT